MDSSTATAVRRTEDSCERHSVLTVAVLIEINFWSSAVAFRDDGQPEPELAEAHCFGLEIDAEEAALHDALAIASAEALEHA